MRLMEAESADMAAILPSASAHAPSPAPSAPYATGLMWFRRDLRLEDNAALYHALRSCRQVHCVFVLDREILDPLPRVDRRVEFIHGDAAGYVSDEKADVAACVGATWIGGGVAGTVELLARSLRTGGIILVGEPYWRQLPPTENVAKGCLANAIADFLMLPELLASLGRLGYDVVEMVLADQDGWDRYEAAKWLTMRRWLEANPDDELAGEVRVQLSSEPERYAAYTREYLGWGVFALMPRGE